MGDSSRSDEDIEDKISFANGGGPLRVKKITKAKAPEVIHSWETVSIMIKQILNLRQFRSYGGSLDETDEQTAEEESDSINTCIPSGFQLIRTLGQSGTTSIKQILHIPNRNEIFGTLDQSYAHLWFGSQSIKLSVSKSKAKETGKNSLPGLEHWQYCRRWKVIVGITSQMEVKMMDLHLKVQSTYRLPYLATCLEYYDDPNMSAPEIIIGSVGIIMVYSLLRSEASVLHPRTIHVDKIRISMTEIENQEWVSCIRLSPKLNVLYAAHESNVSIFNYSTGKRILKLQALHEERISAMVLCELHGFLITGGKDAKIRIWNSNFNLLHELKEHFQTITSLELITVSKGYTFLLSSSKDSNIRMWDIDAGTCVNKINTNDPVNGIKLLQNGTFCTYSDEKISIWTLSRVFIPFATLGSALISLYSIRVSDTPNKLLGFGSNGSIMILSPRTGEKLIQSYPSPKDVSLKEVVYDPFQGYMILLYSTGNQLLMDATFSPCLPIADWIYPAYEERVICSAGLSIQEGVLEKIYHDSRQLYYFLLICGTDSGQLVYRDIRRNGRQSFILQAHSGPVVKVVTSISGNEMLSVSEDQTVKLWKIVYTECKGEEKTLPGVKSLLGSRVTIRLKLTSTLHIPSLPETVSIDRSLSTIGFVHQNSLLIYKRTLNDEFHVVLPASSDDNHPHKIVSVAYSESLGLICSASIDGSVKIWDKKNALVREIQFNEEINAVEFANTRGDLVVALTMQIVAVRIQDYLPRYYLEIIVQQSWVDDVIEDSEFYTLSSNFWRTNRYNEKLAEAPYFLSAQLTGIKKHHLDSKRISSLEALINSAPEKLEEIPLPSSPILESDSSGIPHQLLPVTYPILPAMVSGRIEKDSIKKVTRVYDELEEEPVKYNVPEMNFEKLMARDSTSIMRSSVYFQSESTGSEWESRVQSAEAIAKLEIRRKKQMEKDEEMRLRLQRGRVALISQDDDLMRPNAKGQQAPSLIFKDRSKVAHRKQKKSRLEEARRADSPKDFGNRYELVTLDHEEYTEEEDLEESTDYDKSTPDYSEEVTNIRKKKITSKKKGKQKRKSSKVPTAPVPGIGEEEELGIYTEEEKEEEVLSEEIAKNSGETQKIDFVQQHQQRKEESLVRKKYGRPSHILEALHPRSFTVVDGTIFEALYLLPEVVVIDHCISFQSEISEDSSFTSEIADPVNGFHAATGANPEAPAMKVKAPLPVKKELARQKRQIFAPGEGSAVPAQTDDIRNSRPKSSIDPSLLFTIEEKTSVAWSLFKAAAQKSTEKPVVKEQKEHAVANTVGSSIPSKKNELHTKHVYNDSVHISILKERGIQRISKATKNGPLAKSMVNGTVNRVGTLNQFQMNLKMKDRSSYFFGKGFKAVKDLIHQKEKTMALYEKDNGSKMDQVKKNQLNETMGAELVMTHFESVNPECRPIVRKITPLSLDSSPDNQENVIFEEKKMTNARLVCPENNAEVMHASSAVSKILINQQEINSFLSLDGKGKGSKSSPFLEDFEVFTSPNQLVPQTPSRSARPDTDELRDTLSRRLDPDKVSFDNMNIRRESVRKTEPHQNEEEMYAASNDDSAKPRLSFVRIHVPLFLDKHFQVPTNEKENTYQSLFTPSAISSGRMVEAIQGTDWFDNMSGKQATVLGVLHCLINAIQSKTEEAERIDAAMGARFVIETFRNDIVKEGRKQVEDIIEMHVDTLMGNSSDSLKVQLIRNIGVGKVKNESVMEALIVSLASESLGVRNAALETLGEFGVTTSEELENRMNSLQMFPELYTGQKEKFVHPLDPFIDDIKEAERQKYILSFELVHMWHKKFPFDNLDKLEKRRPSSSTLTLVPRAQAPTRSSNTEFAQDTTTSRKLVAPSRYSRTLPPSRFRLLDPIFTAQHHQAYLISKDHYL